jgi:SAM-dependent methyltransferase
VHDKDDLSSEERAVRERFDGLYMRACSPVMVAIERSVCGCDYGGNSWTTRAEAERMAECLGLCAGMHLLDLGAGSGWPGLYLAKTTGCDLTLVDLPLSGLKIARERAMQDCMSERVKVVLGDAAALPLKDETFDAISHSDLLCCLTRKRAVLTACRRAVRPEGRMAFSVIYVQPGLSPKRYRRAVANGPPFVETDTAYPALLAETGWRITGRTDVTAAYAGSCRRQLEVDEASKVDLTALIGADEFAERVCGWRAKLEVLKEGLLRRELFVAVPGEAG